MTQEDGGQSAPINHTRQITIDALCEHFANDAMTVEEFERRVDLAHGASSRDELRALLSDLPSGDLPAPVESAAPSVRGATVPAEHVKENGHHIAILGGVRRTGRWTPARTNHVVAIMGGAELDFREAALPAGVTEVKIYTIMGGAEVIVPPGLAVESHGIGILGGFEHAGDDGFALDPSAPVLRVTGISLMGGVEITVRHPGETARDARRRRRQERRDRRRRNKLMDGNQLTDRIESRVDKVRRRLD